MKKAVVTWEEVVGVDGYNVYLDGVKHNSVIISASPYDIEGIADGNHSVEVTSVGNGEESLPSNAVAFEVVDVPSPYKFFRLTILNTYSTESWRGTKEFGLFGTVGDDVANTLAVTAGGTASAIGFHPSYPPQNALNGNTGVYSVDNNGWLVSNTDPVWIQIEFAEPQTILEYGVGSANENLRGAKDITVEGSDDGVTWDILDERTLGGWSSSTNFRRFTL